MTTDSKFTRLLVLGGARSGKSRYAQQLADRCWKRPLYLATAEVKDKEMARRVQAHRQARGARWECVEEPMNIAEVLTTNVADADGILVDCMTLWLSNVLLKEGPAAIEKRQQALLKAVRNVRRNLILVSNEVGMGIVPKYELGRTFRDQAGWLNQALAATVDTVVLVVAGLPMILKGTLTNWR
ncbi:MAG: bifunctional adenosylcobinamide kinase/adenosylcobinamide-phosphate guanylyltransferase, partial [Verrucomicrobia bacterium]|nr:bifunctional adenosylcobinamide kinase/adenosylcobinamide-phosphate guanylyltransferase [Verrucomicrobiota bacterium]